MERRSLLKGLLVAPLLPLAQTGSQQTVDRRTWAYVPNTNLMVKPTSFVVSTLEHSGWGYKDEQDPAGTKYVSWRAFDSKQKAEKFVRSLIPKISCMEVRKDDSVDQIRSGYRGAVRFQFHGGIKKMEVVLVSRQKDGTYKPVLENHLPWWDVPTAWAYLSNIRVNGEPVSRSVNGTMSEYLIQPFVAKDAEIIEV